MQSCIFSLIDLKLWFSTFTLTCFVSFNLAMYPCKILKLKPEVELGKKWEQLHTFAACQLDLQGFSSAPRNVWNLFLS